jgi:signal transduction histidine kinase
LKQGDEMVQLPPIEQSNGKASTNGQKNDRRFLEKVQQRRKLVTQLGAISSLIEQNVQDLTQPMTVILGLSELIFTQTEPGSDLAADLVAITKQIKRMSQTVNEVNDLVEQRKRLLETLGTLQLGTARLEERATGNRAMREE